MVISSRYRPNVAALSDVPRAASTMSLGRCFSQPAAEFFNSGEFAKKSPFERLRLLLDLFEHLRHYLMVATGRVYKPNWRR